VVVTRDLEAQDLLLENPHARRPRVDEHRAAPASEAGVGFGGPDREGVAGEGEGRPEGVGLDRRREGGLERLCFCLAQIHVDPIFVRRWFRGYDEGVIF
jgi:hypothetical protein